MEIVIVDSGYQSYDYEKELFGKNGFRLKIYPEYKGDPDEKKKLALSADGLLVRHTKIDRAFLSGMKNLKAIVRYGIGYDNIDIDACSGLGIKVANVQGYANHAVSDHALALMLSCTRGLWNTRFQLERMFAAPPVNDIIELHDKTLGIIGLGRIGSVFSSKARSLFGQVIASDPYKPDEHFAKFGVKRVILNELLSESDVISIHCNLTEETRHLINKGTLLLMKKRPVIINTSRGGVIDESAFLDALNSDRIHSAGLDVFENEPVTRKQHNLISHPRVICTGHYAWYSVRAAVELQRRAANNLLDLLLGNPVLDCLNS